MFARCRYKSYVFLFALNNVTPKNICTYFRTIKLVLWYILALSAKNVGDGAPDVPLCSFVLLHIALYYLRFLHQIFMTLNVMRSVRKFGQYFNFKPILRHLSLDSPAKM